MFKQAVPDIGLSVEFATDSVPPDGNYHVLLNGQVVFRTPSKARALREYRRLRDDALAKSASSKPEVDRAAALRRARALDDLRPLAPAKGVRSKLRIGARRGHR